MKFTHFNLFFVIVILISFNPISYAQTIKVACVGDSVTFGMGIENREQNCYPAQLQKLLGEPYEVANFGYSGATMLKNGHKPYWDKEVFKNSQDFLPNIVIIHLGLNDQGNNNWPTHKDEFEGDYLEMIALYKNLPSKPTVIICRMTPTFSGHHWFEEGMRESFKEIQTKIEEIAVKAKVALIDLHEPLYRFPEYFPDNLHPTKEGAKIIAQKVYSVITGNYGGLQLPLLFGENMVLQRNEPIKINGKANKMDTIVVKLNNNEATTTVATNGSWNVILPKMEAGGPYKLSISSKLSEAIQINKVYIGEVWLASGQSNMDFKVKAMNHADSVLKDSINNNVFLYSMDPKALDSNTYSEEEIKNCNAASYFKNSGWTNNDSNNFENFSAVAYAFAYNLQKELNIPIGIICNAIGGSPTQSWISRENMELQHETIDLLNDSDLNPMVDSWVSKRKVLSFKNFSQYNIKARHPYDPTFLFDAGIQPIKNYTIKGVIWYQGESNAEQTALHSKLFKILVNDWRMQFKNPEMPFYYVQLSSINRPTWGKFRDSQRKLLTIPYTGMAVCSDIGHPTDVHPKEKWIVGERLSKIALHKNYNFSNEFSGPLLDFVNVKGNKLQVYFKHAEGLTTSNGKQVSDIFIASSDKIFVPAKTKINNNILEVWSSEITNPRYLKYGYTSFTNGNLINKQDLPASTFSNLFE